MKRMKIKGSKIGVGKWISLGLPSIFFLCIFFFFAGFFGSSLFSQQVRLFVYLFIHFSNLDRVCERNGHCFGSVWQEVPSFLRPRVRQTAEEEKMEFEALPRGNSGERSVETIPFQVYFSHGFRFNSICFVQHQSGGLTQVYQ